MKIRQLLVAALISVTAFASHAAFVANMTPAQIRAEISAQQAAGASLNAIAVSAAAAGLNMGSFVSALVTMPGINVAAAVTAAVQAAPGSAAAIAAAAAAALPGSAAIIAAAAAAAAPGSADAIAAAVANVVPAASAEIYAAVQQATQDSTFSTTSQPAPGTTSTVSPS